MPNLKSSEKALRQNIRHRQRNLQRKKVLKATIKEYKKALETNPEEAAQRLPTVYKKLDKMAKVNLIKQGKADRLKSRLSKRLSPKESK